MKATSPAPTLRNARRETATIVPTLLIVFPEAWCLAVLCYFGQPGLCIDGNSTIIEAPIERDEVSNGKVQQRSRIIGIGVGTAETIGGLAASLLRRTRTCIFDGSENQSSVAIIVDLKLRMARLLDMYTRIVRVDPVTGLGCVVSTEIQIAGREIYCDRPLGGRANYNGDSSSYRASTAVRGWCDGD